MKTFYLIIGILALAITSGYLYSYIDYQNQRIEKLENQSSSQQYSAPSPLSSPQIVPTANKIITKQKIANPEPTKEEKLDPDIVKRIESIKITPPAEFKTRELSKPDLDSITNPKIERAPEMGICYTNPVSHLEICN